MTKSKLIFLTYLPNIKQAISYCLYAIFAGYIGYIVLTTPTMIAKAFFLISGLLVLGILALFEYLKGLYGKMINSLTVACDIQQALHYKEQLSRYDLFKGFKHSLILFDGLLLLDQGFYHDCLTHLADHHDFYHSTPDYLLIANRTSLQCAYFLQDSSAFNVAYQHLIKLDQGTAKKRTISPLYSWEEIRGLHFFWQQRNTQAQKTLQAITTERFNQREEAYLLFERAQVEFALGHNTQGNRLLKEVQNRSNTLYLTKLAAEKRRIIFEKH